MGSNRVTFVLIPGLLSDEYVWSCIHEELTKYGKVLNADNKSFRRISDFANHILCQTEGDLILIGHSMGGRIAMEVAHQSPERVKALILANTGHSPKKDGEEIPRQKKIDLGYENFKKLADEWIPPMLDEARIKDEALINSLEEMVFRQSPKIHEDQITALVHRPNATAYLPEITCPCLLVTGQQDRWSPVAQHEEMLKLLPNASLEVINHAGHFMPVEQPDRTKDILLNWLKQQQIIPA